MRRCPIAVFATGWHFNFSRAKFAASIFLHAFKWYGIEATVIL